MMGIISVALRSCPGRAWSQGKETEHKTPAGSTLAPLTLSLLKTNSVNNKGPGMGGEVTGWGREEGETEEGSGLSVYF